MIFLNSIFCKACFKYAESRFNRVQGYKINNQLNNDFTRIWSTMMITSLHFKVQAPLTLSHGHERAGKYSIQNITQIFNSSI